MYILLTEGVDHMQVTVQQWGNSQGIRIPKSIITAMKISINDRLEIDNNDDTITIKKVSQNRHKTIEERLESFYGKPLEQIQPVPPEPETDWGKPAGNEEW
jgi:antitoxin MazE